MIEIAAVCWGLGSKAYLWAGEAVIRATQRDKNGCFWSSAATAAEKGGYNWKLPLHS